MQAKKEQHTTYVFTFEPDEIEILQSLCRMNMTIPELFDRNPKSEKYKRIFNFQNAVLNAVANAS